MVRLCNDWSVKTVIATNAKLLDEKRIDALLTDPPSELLVAYETGQVEAYEKHRRGGNLELLVHNIKGFVEERNRRGQPSPRVKLQTVVSRETVSHMESSGGTRNCWVSTKPAPSPSLSGPMGTMRTGR